MRAVEHHLPQCAERTEHFIGAQENCIGREDRPLDVVAQALVARAQVGLKREDLRLESAGYHCNAIFGQVVEESDFPMRIIAFVASEIDFREADLDFVDSEIDSYASEIDFGAQEIDFGEAGIDFEALEI